MNEDEIRLIPLELLNPPRILLRALDKQSLGYMQIRDTIRDGELLNSICVRPDPREPGKFEIVDGFYRYNAYLDLGRQSIPAIVVQKTDEECLAAQVRANSIRADTTPVDFARQLKRLQELQPEITLSAMAVMVGHSKDWVTSQLLLLRLIKDAQKHVDRDEMPLANAYMLAKIPPSYQRAYIAKALTLSTKEFKALAASVIRGFMEAARQGRLHNFYTDEFKPVAFLRPLSHVLSEVAMKEQGVKFLMESQCKSPLEAWTAALKWAASLDAESVARQQKAAELRHKRQVIERDSYVDAIDSEDPPTHPA